MELIQNWKATPNRMAVVIKQNSSNLFIFMSQGTFMLKWKSDAKQHAKKTKFTSYDICMVCLFGNDFFPTELLAYS